MKRVIVVSVVVLAAVSVAVTAAFAKSSSRSANAAVCVLLPDSKSSVRWETQDRRYLAQNFKRAGVSYSIVNAEGDAQRQKSQGDTCLANGAKVILLVNLDSGSGAAIEAAAKARAPSRSTTTGSRSTAARRTTSRSTTCRSGSSRVRASSPT